MQVCYIELYWEKVSCDIYQVVEVEETSAKASGGGRVPRGEQNLEDFDGLLPTNIVYPVMLFAEFQKFLLAFIGGGPFILIPWSFAFIDWVIEVLLMYTIGLACKPCALGPIWVISIITLPIYVIGWFFRFILETYALLFKGWLLAFNFSGCYLIFGRHCGKLNPKFTPHRLDIPVLSSLMGLGSADVSSNIFADIVKP